MDALTKFVETLRQTQRMAADELAAYQRRPLERLLRHSYATVPFYRDRLAPLFRKTGSIAWERWDEVPFLTRSEIQENGENLTSRSVPAQHGAVSLFNSSGSTGRPIVVRKTALNQIAYSAVKTRYHDWHGIDRSLKLAAIRHANAGDAKYPEGAHNPVWATYAAHLKCTGPEAVLNIHTPVHQQAEWLARERPDYLHTFPTNAAALADFIAHAPGLGPRFPLRGILTFSEIVTEDARLRCRDTFGVEIIDGYSSVECGFLAHQCSDHAHYHVPCEVIRIEILNEENAACGPGELGRVVATPLYNYAMPLIRYETGDYAVTGEPCPCGRGLPVLARIAGRRRNIFRFPGGEHVVPEFMTEPFTEHLRPRQWQVAQTGPLELEVRLVPGDEHDRLDYDAMTGYIHRLLRPDLTVKYRFVDEFPATPGRKHEAHICELTEDP